MFVWIFFAVALILHVVLSRTPFGRWNFAVGGNYEASAASAVPVRFTRAAAFVLTGLLSGMCGVLIALSIGQARPIIGAGYEFVAITAVVIGGTSLFGGRGSILRTVGGVIILALISNLIVLIGWPTPATGLATGNHPPRGGRDRRLSPAQDGGAVMPAQPQDARQSRRPLSPAGDARGVAIFGGLTLDDFLTLTTLQSMLDRAAVVGFLALGLTPILIAGQIDLSIGSIMSLAAYAAIALQPEVGSLAAAIIGLGVGVLAGAINAVIVVVLKVTSLVATLATLLIGASLALLISDGQPVSSGDPLFGLFLTDNFLAVLTPRAALFIGAALLMFVWLKATPSGRHLYAVGSSMPAAVAAGINVNAYIAGIFVLSGLCAGAAGVIQALSSATGSPARRLGVADPGDHGGRHRRHPARGRARLLARHAWRRGRPRARSRRCPSTTGSLPTRRPYTLA